MDFSLLDDYETPTKKRKISDDNSAPARSSQRSTPNSEPTQQRSDRRKSTSDKKQAKKKNEDNQSSAHEKFDFEDDDSIQYESRAHNGRSNDDFYSLEQKEELELASEGFKDAEQPGDYIMPAFQASRSVLELFNQYFNLIPLRDRDPSNPLQPVYRLVLKTDFEPYNYSMEPEYPEPIATTIIEEHRPTEFVSVPPQPPKPKPKPRAAPKPNMTTEEAETARLWSRSEDAAIESEANSYLASGRQPKWELIAARLRNYGKTAAQIKHRYYQWLDPTVRKGPYTEMEDKIMFNILREHLVPSEDGLIAFRNVTLATILETAQRFGRNEHQIRFHFKILRRKLKEHLEKEMAASAAPVQNLLWVPQDPDLC